MRGYSQLSIRWRLALWYSAVLLLGLALFGAGIWLALEQKLVAGVDTRLAQKARAVQTVLELEQVTTDRAQAQMELSEFAKEVPDGQLIQIADAGGGFLVPAAGAPFFPAQWMSEAAGARTVEQGGRHYRVFVTKFDHAGQTYRALLGTPLDDVNAVIGELRNLLLAVVPAVLLVASIGGYWVSRRALAPVDEITRVAKSIHVQNLSSRLAVPRTGDELQRLSETWNEMLERLEGAVKRIRQFTADASHELRTPVTLIRSTAELALRRERGPEEYRIALAAIEGEAKRMTELTTSLLTLARADSDEIHLMLRPTNVAAVVSEAAEQNRAAAEAKGIALRTEASGAVLEADANEAGLRRILLVLIDNALQYTAVSGSVTVGVRGDEAGITVFVRDTGEGIPPDALPHIFDRFFRAHPARSNGGAGLGLSIAQAIARAHGSKIGVESVEGMGACFSFTLPVGLSRNFQAVPVAS